MAGALLVLLFFLPLAAVFGLRRARRARAALTGNEGLAGPLSRLLTMPLLVLLCLLVALADIGSQGAGQIAALLSLRTDGAVAPGAPPTIYTGIGAMDFVLWLMLKVGQLMLILFFLSVPYVLGSLVAAGLLVLDRAGRTTVLRRAAPERDAPDLDTGP